MGKETKGELEIIHFVDQAQWRKWLSKNADDVPGVWTKFAKKGSGIESLNYAEALDVALCFGWIDGQVNKYDERFYLQRFTPRRAKSKWSKINVGHVARLVASGEMQPRGFAEVEKAKADGRWEAAYASPSNMTVPGDLQSALDAEPTAAAAFATLKAADRYSILYRIHEAKRPDTRERRIRKFVDQLSSGELPS